MRSQNIVNWQAKIARIYALKYTFRVFWRGNSRFDVSDESLVLITMLDVPTVIKCGYGPLVTRVAKLCVELQCAIAMSFVLSEINTIF